MKKLLFLIPCMLLLFANDAYSRGHGKHSEDRTRYVDNMNMDRDINRGRDRGIDRGDRRDKDKTPYCKRYSREVRKGAGVEEEYGTACLDKDGNWRVKK